MLEIRERNDSKSQSLKAFIFATVLILLLLNMAFILPMPVVRAESDGQTSSACSSCQQQRLAETSHYVTVNIVHRRILIQIEPLILPETGCGSCSQNQGCPATTAPTYIQTMVLEQDETHSVTLLTFEFNGTTFEATVTTTLLWSYNKITHQANKTAMFSSTEIVTQDGSSKFYSLGYMVQHEEYRLSLFTRLMSSDTETYSSSFTKMDYAPADKTGLVSMELVEFKTSVTLSQQYAVLGKVAKEMGKHYAKSRNDTLAKLAKGYFIMSEEGKNLSKLVESHLRIYNREILQSSVVLTDILITPDTLCQQHWECEFTYGPGWCCCDGVCQECPCSQPPPPPPPDSCAGCQTMVWFVCNLGCELAFVAAESFFCGPLCAIPGGQVACAACILLILGINIAVCNIVNQYGCGPGSLWLCQQLGYCS